MGHWADHGWSVTILSAWSDNRLPHPCAVSLLPALISLSFGGAVGLMFLMLGCALPVYEWVWPVPKTRCSLCAECQLLQWPQWRICSAGALIQGIELLILTWVLTTAEEIRYLHCRMSHWMFVFSLWPAVPTLVKKSPDALLTLPSTAGAIIVVCLWS